MPDLLRFISGERQTDRQTETETQREKERERERESSQQTFFLIMTRRNDDEVRGEGIKYFSFLVIKRRNTSFKCESADD